MLLNYGYIALFLIIGIVFTLTILTTPQILKKIKIIPNNPTQIKGEPFECGMRTIGKTWIQFNIRYYFYALIFLALDVMVVFLYPWAAELKNIGSSGFEIMVILIVMVFVGYVYAWKKRALEWK